MAGGLTCLARVSPGWIQLHRLVGQSDSGGLRRYKRLVRELAACVGLLRVDKAGKVLELNLLSELFEDFDYPEMISTTLIRGSLSRSARPRHDLARPPRPG
jgi:hypothetical protein